MCEELAEAKTGHEFRGCRGVSKERHLLASTYWVGNLLRGQPAGRISTLRPKASAG